MNISELAVQVLLVAEVAFVIVSLLGAIVYPFAVVQHDDQMLRHPGVAEGWLFYGM